jgi:large repetitive protein
MAAITQLFYTNNFLHDWFYDSGFDEAAGNAQTSNFGRGGVEGDNLRVEAQDYNGLNNANMATPADGSRPRMQMFVWNPASTQRVTVNSPASIAGDKAAGYSLFGPQSYSVTADVVVVNDGTGTPTDACQPILNSVAGKIALIDNGTCTVQTKICAAQAAGAAGVIIANTTNSVFIVAGSQPSCGVTIPTLVITLADANAIKGALVSGPVNVTLFRQASILRDGTIDNSIIAHEWAHYLSNRLIGNSTGLSNNQGGGMGEGWSDFTAMLLVVKPEDASVPSNVNWTGTWGLAQYALHSSLAATNVYYFGLRRYPYSTDFNKDPLTFRHIQQGVPLPVGPPVNTTITDGSVNHQVHRTGEVWCTMLWQCYSSLLRDSGRLDFDEARDRMRGYLVAGLKMTPNAPTILEARDALLAATYAGDPDDYQAFCTAFALRGAGVGAVGPDRHSLDNVGVTESYLCGGDLKLVSAVLDDAVHSCDHDGYLDEGEVGYLTVTLKNTGSTALSATTATLSSTNPSVVFQSGPTLGFPPSQPFGTTTAAAFVRSSGASGVQTQDIQIQFNDPGFAVAGPRIANTTAHGNTDELPSLIETVEARMPNWTFSGPVLSPAFEPWRRLEISGTDHRFYAPSAGSISDQSLISPPIQLPPTSFGFSFQHAWSFESSGGIHFDGGVIEITDNGGALWTDLGASLSPAYNGTIYSLSGNPLAGRPGYVGQSASYPALTGGNVFLGTAYANKTVQFRFRLGSDGGTSSPGWSVDNVNMSLMPIIGPFLGLQSDPGPCTPVAVEGDRLPSELSFEVAGPNPGRGGNGFRFALPRAARMRITIHDVTGRRVATVADGDYPAGVHEASWTASAEGAKPGVYFARMVTAGREITRRLVVLSR